MKNQEQTQNRPSALAILEPRRDVIAGLLKPESSADLERFLRSAAFAVARNPALIQCTPSSIVEAVCTGAELRLDFAPSLGLAYMVPYGRTAQFQIGYRGLIALALRSGKVMAIEAYCVHERDDFSADLGTQPRLVHRRARLGEPRGAIIGAYAVASLVDGARQADLMDVSEIEAVRKRSRSGENGPWVTDYAEMARKTVTKRLCKYLPLTPDMGLALERDNEGSDVSVAPSGDDRPSNTATIAARLGVGVPGPEGEAVETTDSETATDGEVPF